MAGFVALPMAVNAADNIGEAKVMDATGMASVSQLATAVLASSRFKIVTMVAKGGTEEQLAALQSTAGKVEKIIKQNILILKGTDDKPDDGVFMVEIVVPNRTPANWKATRQDELAVEQMVAAIRLTKKGEVSPPKGRSPKKRAVKPGAQ